MSKHDEIVSLTSKGKIKIRLNEIKRACFSRCLMEMVKNCETDIQLSQQLSVISYSFRAELEMLMGIYKQYFNNHDYKQPLILNLTKTEALLLWVAYENHCNCYAPLTRSVMADLHQKLS